MEELPSSTQQLTAYFPTTISTILYRTMDTETIVIQCQSDDMIKHHFKEKVKCMECSIDYYNVVGSTDRFRLGLLLPAIYFLQYLALGLVWHTTYGKEMKANAFELVVGIIVSGLMIFGDLCEKFTSILFAYHSGFVKHHGSNIDLVGNVSIMVMELILIAFTVLTCLLIVYYQSSITDMILNSTAIFIISELDDKLFKIVRIKVDSGMDVNEDTHELRDAKGEIVTVKAIIIGVSMIISLAILLAVYLNYGN